MRQLLALIFGVAILLALAVPSTYLLLERDLPPLESHDDVVHTVKIAVEGERQKELAGIDPRLVEPFTPLGKEDFAPALLAGALATQGCPDYFTLPKEQGTTWLTRLVGYGAGSGFGGPGPGKCELQYADRLANALGLPADAHRAIAIHEIHDALDKQELLQLELSARYFAPGILGVRAASKKLMGKEPRALTVAESAELLLAELDYGEILGCKNPIVLRQKRNNVIDTMAAFNLVKKPEAERAKGEKLHCLSRPG